jgi:aspartate aminotransferase-like enzyme
MTRLFIPGPTNVDNRTLEAMRQPMISHRSAEFQELFARIQVGLQETLKTTNRIFVTTSSGTGLFEGAMRNTVAERILVCVCGAFGERWYDVALRNNIRADRLDIPWGEPNTPAQIKDQLNTQKYDALAIVHNETSTGVENPIAEIITATREIQPEIVILVDAVSSAAGADIRTDEWGIDILIMNGESISSSPHHKSALRFHQDLHSQR